MRILIFGESFPPPAYQPRLRYFCSYLLKKGWEVDLVFEHLDNQNCIPEASSALPLSYYKYRQGIKSKIEWLYKFLINIFFDHKGRFFYKKSQIFLVGKQFDAVFCSTSFTFPLTTAGMTAKKRNIPLFADMRDIIEQSPDDDYLINRKTPMFFGKLISSCYKKVNVRRRNKVLKASAVITTVSPWHVRTLSKYNSNVQLIYNGFDEEKFTPETTDTPYFTIIYFGRIYNEKMRNPRLLFSAVRELDKKQILSSKNTVVKWFLDEKSKNVIQKIAKEYDMDEYMQYYDFVQPDKLPVEMSKSSIFLILCNIETKKRFFGIMTTKFFEAIGANRPVLCVPDNKDNLSRLVRETNCGLASSDVLEVEDFLLEKFREWKQTGTTKGMIDEGVRTNFSRKKGAEILENLFLNTIEKRRK